MVRAFTAGIAVAMTATAAHALRPPTDAYVRSAGIERESALYGPDASAAFLSMSPTIQQQSNDQSAAAAKLESALRANKPSRQIGRLDGNTPDVFGRIRKVVTNKAGDIFVLDDLMMEIRWFDKNGGLRGTAGGQGSGPGEFRTPSALFVDDGDAVYAWDRRNSRVSFFRTNERGLIHERDLRVEFGIDDLCVLGGEFYLLSPYDSLSVRRMALDGKALGSFGPRIQAAHLIDARLEGIPELAKSFRAGYNSAIMHCDADRGTIVLVYRQLPLIRAFRARTGELLWESELGNYHQMRWVPVPGSKAYQQAADPKTKTVTQANAALPLERDILGISLIDGGLLKGSSTEREIRLISLTDGRELKRLATPLVIAGRQGNVLYAYTNHPYPRVVLYDYPDVRGNR